MSNNTSAAELKREHELNLVAELEDGLSELARPQVSRFTHSDFLRVGLPILSGMLDDTFNPMRWEEFVGNQYVGLEVIDDVTGELIYDIPPLMRQAPTAIYDDPNRESLTSETQHLLAIRDYNPNEVSAQILRIAEDTVSRQNGGLEYGTVEELRRTMETLNQIFRDNNLSELPMPDYLVDVKASKPETDDVVKEEKEKVSVNYDLDEGEEL